MVSREHQMVTVGIDCGAKNTKVVFLKNKEILGSASVLTGFDQKLAVDRSLASAIDITGISRADIKRVAATGSGKNAVTIADVLVNDIKAMAHAARFFCPSARTVVDIGAEEGRAARINDRGEALDFAVNDKCAAGAGVFIEAMARALEVSLDEIGPLCLQSDREIPMNAQCVIFAESEVVGLIHANTEKADISKAIHDAIAGRILSLIQRIGIRQDVVVLGGVGRNRGLIACLQRELGLSNLCIPAQPELGAAVGAALVAAEKL